MSVMQAEKNGLAQEERQAKELWLREKGDPFRLHFFLICTLNAEGSPQNIYIYT